VVVQLIDLSLHAFPPRACAGVGVGDEPGDQRYRDEREPYAHKDQDHREDLARRVQGPDLAEADGREREDRHVERVEE